MPKPLISIITINLNNAAGLQRTLQSVKAQTWQQFEYIVVDGDSTDDSKKIMEHFGDIISQSICEKDNGIYHAMNKGWQMSRGRYCLFLNAGDTLHNAEVLEKVSANIVAGFVDFYYGNILGIGEDETHTITTFNEPVSLQYLFRWYLPHPASFIKRDLLIKLNGYSQNYRIISDWIFSVQAFMHGHVFKHLPITVSNFYADGISTTQHGISSEEKKIVFEQELSFLKHDWIWFQKMRPLELSRPVKFLYGLLTRFKT